VRPPVAGGYGLDASWADEWHHALHTVLTGERSGYYADFGTLAQLGTALRQAWVYDGGYSAERDRTHGRSPVGLPGAAFVVSAQNHDQVGNRAAGDRLPASLSPGRLRVAAAFLLTAPFVPLLFQGEEWGASSPFQYFTNHPDPALGAAVSAGRKREFAHFGWDPADVPDPQDRATFLASKLTWDEVATGDHAALLGWYRALVALRRREPDLGTAPAGSPTVTVDEDAGWLALHRGQVTVAANLAPEARTLPVTGTGPGTGTGTGMVLLASDDAVTLTDAGLSLPPDSVAIVTTRTAG
jgi:maltooligosyltrehalose trehalohydrolase